MHGSNSMPPPRQARFWLLTLSHHLFVPWLPPPVVHLQGQLERGEGGFVHWQVVASFRKKVSLAGVRAVFGDAHAEPTRSDAARQYVFKDDTRVEGELINLLKVRNSSWVNSRSEETLPQTGIKSEIVPSPETFLAFRQMSTYVVTTNCVELARTICNQLQWSEPVQYSGAEVEVVSRVALGKKLVTRLILRIPEPNGGTDTWAKKMLSLMNSEAPLTSHTFSDGWIDTQYEWKTKVLHCHCVPEPFGSRLTWTPDCGTPI